ncbi:ComF family protein [Cognatiyoonia sp. IB215182]|uniref:ComF family protein n=1 Tax=Cognatiyoonia sp. IB215182 TaxID=3097353 RepID=UPI002A13CBA1|nr:ComF family protein [Cognatiyoonia sp. IB215182]MDX8355306.1 ComF family protein [Cognatiyoonia sp. IB215182]
MKTNIKRISGNWTDGFALDKHKIKSTPIGYNDYGHMQFDTLRTAVGEAVFQLKYRGDFGQVKPLAKAVVKNIVPQLGRIGFVVPAPASLVRKRQPVLEVATEVAAQMNVPVFNNTVTKVAAVANTPLLKNMTSKADKVETLKGRFALNDEIQNQGRWNVLVVDDLYDSGATLEAICTILSSYRKVANIYVAALTWK